MSFLFKFIVVKEKNPFAIFLDFFLQRLKHMDMD